MTSRHSKVFGIGLSKTGTTSLANALQILGYKTKDNMGVVKYAAGDLSSVDLELVDTFAALTDTPIPSFYRELDTRYPGSKFVLTVRDSDGWLKSCKKQFTQRFAQVQTEAHKHLFMDLYGTDVFDEERFARGHDRFVAGVRDYFKDRPGDLLIINVSAGEGWEKLCVFLDRPVPDIPFPKANVTRVRWMAIEEVIAVATGAGQELMRRRAREHRISIPGRHGPDAPLQNAKQLVERAIQALLGDRGAQAASRAAHKLIVRGLIKLNPEIPVLSRRGHIVAHAERRAWNHLWLVDPLDGEGAFASETGDFSINIALIEDGRPICGVVYAPAIDTIYYATSGKGAYRRTRDAEAVRLPSGGSPQIASLAGTRGSDTAVRAAGNVSSHALAMCQFAAGTASSEATFQSLMEWQTAAAQAILQGAGMRVCDDGSGKEPSYNTKDLSSGHVRVESRAAVQAE